MYYDRLFCERPNTFQCCELMSTFKFLKIQINYIYFYMTLYLKCDPMYRHFDGETSKKKTSTGLIVLYFSSMSM